LSPPYSALAEAGADNTKMSSHGKGIRRPAFTNSLPEEAVIHLFRKKLVGCSSDRRSAGSSQSGRSFS
jgi:hypothetical protein